MDKKRSAGILMPVFSLPGEYGIGSFGKDAEEFIDIVAETGNRVWQVLPMGPTSYGDSPYQSFSSFAINPYFIDLEGLKEEGLLTEEELKEEKEAFLSSGEKIDYGLLYQRRYPLLKKAYERWKAAGGNPDTLIAGRRRENLDYCLFMALKDFFEGCAWPDFPKEFRDKEESALKSFLKEHKDEVAYYAFMQWKAEAQWKAVQDYAHERGVLIFGDLPIYCAMDSADVWGNRKIFDFSWEGRKLKKEEAEETPEKEQEKQDILQSAEEKGYPGFVAGVPPDAFSATGQLWGNPLYDWEEQAKDNYSFWCKRMEYCFSLYDLIRIDHFRGFEAYYAVPFGEETAVNGSWRKGPGIALFDAFHRYFQKESLPVIAEDLGIIPEEVRELMRKTAYPGMKVLQFAFGGDYENDYLPHMFQDNNSVMYTGTHDNDTLRNWFETLGEEERNKIYRYLSRSQNDWNAMTELLIKEALSATSYLCIIPAGDYLELLSEGRINAPGTDAGNWQWRMKKHAFSPERKKIMRDMLETYGRRTDKR